MKLTILTIILISSFAFLTFPKEAKSEDNYCVKGSYPPKDSALTDFHELNLDLPPNLRWAKIGALQKNKLKDILNLFKSVLLVVTPYAQKLIDYVDKNFESLVDLMPHPYNDELRGLATASETNLGELFFYNIFYEFFTVCTSVVARDDRGHIYHARNLDFGIFMGWDTQKDKWLMSELLRNSTMHIQWTRKGKPLFKSVNFAGFIGVLTGIKPGKFAFSVNERFNIDGGFLGLIKWVLGYRDSSWLSFISRRIMETCGCYQEAKDILTSKELIAPVYFILSGTQPEEACVITRSRLKTLDVWEIGTNGYNRTGDNNKNNNDDKDDNNNNINVKNFQNNNDQNMANFTNSLSSVDSNPLSNNKLSINNHNNPSKKPDQKLYFRSTKKDRILRSLLSSPISSGDNMADPYFYVLETNYDHWDKPPFYDDRRTTARNCLNQLTSHKVDFASLFDLLSTKPMLNKLTVYTSLMHVESGRLESYMQDCADPCPPW